MRDERVEAVLKRGQYKYRYVEKLLFSDIDLKASEENPARLRRKIDQFTVDQYFYAMVDGAVFPCIVVFEQDQEKHLVGTGMHRIKAAILAERDEFDAFVVTEPDQYRSEVLLRLLNTVEGARDSRKDQLWHIFSLHERFQRHSLKELAKQFNVSHNTVLNGWAEYQGIKRASRLGFDFEGKQPSATIVSLSQIPSDQVYVKAGLFVSHFDVKAREVEEMVHELKAVRSKGQDEEFSVVKKYHDAAEEAAQRAKSRIGKTSPTACTKFVGKCRAINKQAAKGIEHLHLSALANPDDALTVIEDSIDYLAKVKAELERIMRMSGGSASSGLPMAAAGS